MAVDKPCFLASLTPRGGIDISRSGIGRVLHFQCKWYALPNLVIKTSGLFGLPLELAVGPPCDLPFPFGGAAELAADAAPSFPSLFFLISLSFSCNSAQLPLEEHSNPTVGQHWPGVDMDVPIPSLGATCGDAELRGS